MYSICYVLVDDEKFKYYHEMIISIYSLRKRGFYGDVYVLLDQNTKNNIDLSKSDECNQLNIRFSVVDVPDSLSRVMRSRYIKTSMRDYIEGDFLYIDTDTIIADELPNEIDSHDIALVYETNCRLSELAPWIMDYEAHYQEKCGYGTLDLEKPYYNSGVIWAKDTELVHCFFKKWHENWKKYAMDGEGISIDQPALNQTNLEMGGVIHRLLDIYNFQVPSDPFPVQFLSEAKILHYFHDKAESLYLLSDRKIQMLDIMDPQIQDIIDNPRRAFKLGTLMHKDNDREILLRSNHYYYIKYIYSRHPMLFRLGEKTLRITMRIVGRIKRIGNKK